MLNKEQKQKLIEIQEKLHSLRPENVIDKEKVAANAEKEKKLIKKMMEKDLNKKNE